MIGGSCLDSSVGGGRWANFVELTPKVYAARTAEFSNEVDFVHWTWILYHWV